jgi:hypothetical protein
LGSSLPPAELARWDSAFFGEVKRLFSTAPEVGKETEAYGGHCVDRTLHRTRSRFDRTCPVSSPRCGSRVCDRTLVWPDQRVRSVLLSESERATGVSGPSRNRSVRSSVQRGRAKWSDDRTRSASGHVRSDASGLNGSILERDQTRALSRPVQRVRSRQRLVLTRTVSCCRVVTRRVRSP